MPFRFHALALLAIIVRLKFACGTLEVEGKMNRVDIGLSSVTGRIMAVGHFSHEQELDLFVRAPDLRSFSIWKWSDKRGIYEQYMEIKHLRLPITNMIAADFDHDGLVDVLVMMYNDKTKTTSMELYVQFEGELRKANWEIPDAQDQPMLWDYNQDMLLDLFGIINGQPVIYRAVSEHINGKVDRLQLTSGGDVMHGMCRLRTPQYSATADFSGDGQADLLVVCLDGYSMEIWRADPGTPGKWTRGRMLKVKHAITGPLTVADVNGDGALDIIYYNSQENSIFILYNTQQKYCTREDAGSSGDKPTCKKKDKLFSMDPNYGFPVTPSLTIKLADLFGSRDGWFGRHAEANLVTADTNGHPLAAIQVGDFDLDGYPDILLVYKSADGAVQRPVILRNLVPKSNMFVQLKEGTSDLDAINDAETIAFLPFTPKTRLPDVIVQTRNQKIIALRNLFFRDAFFLQTEVMTSVCGKGIGKCRELGAAVGRPFGGGQPGGTFKYYFVDNDGVGRVRQSNQLAQSSYQALPLPFMIVGLGRVSNFIENAQVALSNQHTLVSPRLTHLIPNSRLLLVPPRPPFDDKWHAELYIRPADYLLWVGIAAASIITVFGLLTAVFKFREVREDNAEKRRALHSFNFDAL